MHFFANCLSMFHDTQPYVVNAMVVDGLAPSFVRPSAVMVLIKLCKHFVFSGLNKIPVYSYSRMNVSTTCLLILDGRLWI